MAEPFPTMTAADVHALRTGADARRYLCIDVRAPHEYADAHLAAARNVPLDTIDTATVPQTKPLLRIVPAGDGRIWRVWHCMRAAMRASILMAVSVRGWRRDCPWCARVRDLRCHLRFCQKTVY